MVLNSTTVGKMDSPISGGQSGLEEILGNSGTSNTDFLLALDVYYGNQNSFASDSVSEIKDFFRKRGITIIYKLSKN